MCAPTVTLNDGKTMPAVGLGTWKMDDEQARRAVVHAVQGGYRSIDTARVYENEVGVGAGITQLIHQGVVRREDLFVTTKLWNNQQGYETGRQALCESLQRLGLDYVDLYLIHWPCPDRDAFVPSWQALIEGREAGLARSIGVSNFQRHHLEVLAGTSGPVPVVNQVECHPYFQQRELRAFHAEHGIVTEAWSPLGRGAVLTDPVIEQIAAAVDRTPAQVVLRWHLQEGNVVIPKSVTDSRIDENYALFDFALDDKQMNAIRALDRGEAGRSGFHPDRYNGYPTDTK